MNKKFSIIAALIFVVVLVVMWWQGKEPVKPHEGVLEASDVSAVCPQYALS